MECSEGRQSAPHLEKVLEQPGEEIGSNHVVAARRKSREGRKEDVGAGRGRELNRHAWFPSASSFSSPFHCVSISFEFPQIEANLY